MLPALEWPPCRSLAPGATRHGWKVTVCSQFLLRLSTDGPRRCSPPHLPPASPPARPVGFYNGVLAKL